jgi:hypothetical protein
MDGLGESDQPQSISTRYTGVCCMSMTQGYEANHSGKFLESIVNREFSSRGFIIRSYDEDQDNLDMFSPKIVVRNVPYISIYGCQSRSEFVITEYSRKVRIECRWQESRAQLMRSYLIFC